MPMPEDDVEVVNYDAPGIVLILRPGHEADGRHIVNNYFKPWGLLGMSYCRYEVSELVYDELDMLRLGVVATAEAHGVDLAETHDSCSKS